MLRTTVGAGVSADFAQPDHYVVMIGLGGLGLIGLFAMLVLVPVVQFYLMRDWEAMRARLDALIPRGWHNATISSTGAGYPAMWTTTTARVFGVIFAATDAAVGCNVQSQSQKTGTAPSAMMPMMEPTSVFGVRITSSPGPIPAATNPRWIAALQLLHGTTYGCPVYSRIISQARLTNLPKP